MEQKRVKKVINMLVNFLTENFTDKEYLRTKVENMLVNTKIIKDMDRELIHMPMEINMLVNGKNINIMGKVRIYIQTMINTLESGKKTNIIPQII